MKKFLLVAVAALALISSPAHAMRSYNTNDAQSNPAETPPFPDYINDYALTTNTAKTVTWPTSPNADFTIIICPSLTYTSLQSGITVPAADSTSGAGAAIIPPNTPVKFHQGVETAFYLISATAQVCSVSFYAGI